MNLRRFTARYAADTFTTACAAYLAVTAVGQPLWYLAWVTLFNALFTWHLVARITAMRRLDRLMRSPLAYLHLVQAELGGAK